MALVDGIHHVATLTADLDRLIAFYERDFEAGVRLAMEQDGLRHAFIELGPSTMLHPFQLSWAPTPQGEIPPFERGRIDHIAFNARSEEVFREVRRRAVHEDTGYSVVTDMGAALQYSFHDPDGMWIDEFWNKPGVPLDDSVHREHLQTIDFFDLTTEASK